MIHLLFSFKRSKISPLFHFGINLLICCICIAQNKADSAPTSVLDGLRDGHGNILYVEDAIHQVNIIYHFQNEYFCPNIIILQFLNKRTHRILFIDFDILVEGWKKITSSEILARFS